MIILGSCTLKVNYFYQTRSAQTCVAASARNQLKVIDPTVRPAALWIRICIARILTTLVVRIECVYWMCLMSFKETRTQCKRA